MKKYIYPVTVVAVAILAVIIIGRDDSKNQGEGAPNGRLAEEASARADSGEADSRASGEAREDPDRESVPVAMLIPATTESMPKARAEQSPRIRSKNFTLPSGKKVDLKIESVSHSIDVEPDPTGTRFLVNQASGRNYSIYDSDGELVHELPLVADALPELNPRTQFRWYWGRGETMIATLGFIHEVAQNQYPESDTVAYDVRFYSYDLETKRFNEIRVPFIKSGDGLMRLDGISEEGLLLVSQVSPSEDYWDTQKGTFLGFYKIP